MVKQGVGARLLRSEDVDHVFGASGKDIRLNRRKLVNPMVVDGRI
jgi:hypothetical protein